MRADVQEIFKMTPHDKQVMMFSATLSKEIRPVCKKFMNDVSCTTAHPRPRAQAPAHSRRGLWGLAPQHPRHTRATPHARHHRRKHHNHR